MERTNHLNVAGGAVLADSMRSAERAADAATDNAPRVSIGVPAYNCEPYIREALDSILSQTYQDFEIIISDNGSTDGTEAICREYAEMDNRIRFYREDVNRGAAWNFGRVFQLSRGELFKWAATDDVCAPTYLARCIEILDTDDSIVCCHTRTVKIDSAGNKLTNLPDPTDGGMGPNDIRRDASSRRAHRRYLDVLLSSGWGVRTSGLMRSKALARTRPIGSYYGSEKVLMGEISLLGRFYDVPEVLFYQRVHEDASSASQKTAVDQQQFIDPRIKGTNPLRRLRLLKGHLGTIYRYPVGIYTRFMCMLCVVRYMLQLNKWKQFANNFLQKAET